MGEPSPPSQPVPRVWPMRRPLLPLALAFGAGIAVQQELDISRSAVWAGAAGLILAAALAGALRRLGIFRHSLWLLAFCLLGMARLPPETAPRPVPSGRQVVRAEALSALRPADGGWTLLLEARSVRDPGGEERPASGRMLLWIGGGSAGEAAPACPRILPGDRLRLLASVRAPRPSRNFDVPDPAERDRRRGVDLRGFVESCQDVVLEAGAAPAGLARAAEAMRDDVHRFLTGLSLPARGQGVLTALTTGEQGAVPAGTFRDFRRAGLSHLLAVSGLHLAVVAFGAYRLLLWLLACLPALALRLDVRRLAAAGALVATGFFVLLSGAHLPVLRAGIMAGCFLLAVMLRRRPDAWQTLSASFLLILAAWPASLFEPSFQLSFAAVASILLLVPPLSYALRVPLSPAEMPTGMGARLQARAAQLLLVSFASTLGTWPLLAMHFHQASAVGLVANLLAVPWCTLLLVPLGIASAMLLFVFPPAAALTAQAGAWLAEGLAGVAGWFGAFPGGSLHPAAPSLFQSALFVLVLLLVPHIGIRRHAGKLALGAAMLLVGLWLAAQLGPRLARDLEVTFLDVGQGDATLVRCPGGRTLLVDAGPLSPGGFNAGERVVGPALWAHNVQHLDVVAVTHFHPDHVGGAPWVIREFRPREVWLSRPLIEVDDPELTAAVVEARATVRQLRAGDRPELPGCAVDVLWPPPGELPGDENERSLVLRLSHPSGAVLLAGDTGVEAEEGMLRDHPLERLRSLALKVAHHGSDTSSGGDFLAALRPALAVISVGGGNRFNLPAPEVLERLQAVGAHVVRTDRDGAVRLTVSGEGMKVELAVGEEFRLSRPP
ncbi:MAG: DNA internalization-related competence protein ComEC/Rec2 [Myxococcales bacterium]|nr:DNA internalization-related competence protein ComEC/Rec2 [Myxococcales bacterium]